MARPRPRTAPVRIATLPFSLLMTVPSSVYVILACRSMGPIPDSGALARQKIDLQCGPPNRHPKADASLLEGEPPRRCAGAFVCEVFQTNIIHRDAEWTLSGTFC